MGQLLLKSVEGITKWRSCWKVGQLCSYLLTVWEKSCITWSNSLQSAQPSKDFNVVSTFFFRQYNVTTWGNVKSTLKQRCVFPCWNLQRRINDVYFNVDINNVRQRRNNVVIFNVEFHETTLWKWTSLKRTKKIISNRLDGIQSFNSYFIIFLLYSPC